MLSGPRRRPRLREFRTPNFRLPCVIKCHSRQKEDNSSPLPAVGLLRLTYLINQLFMLTYLLLLLSGDLLLFVSRYLLIVKRNTRCKCPEWTPNQSLVKCWTALFRCHDRLLIPFPNLYLRYLLNEWSPFSFLITFYHSKTRGKFFSSAWMYVSKQGVKWGVMWRNTACATWDYHTDGANVTRLIAYKVNASINQKLFTK